MHKLLYYVWTKNMLTLRLLCVLLFTVSVAFPVDANDSLKNRFRTAANSDEKFKAGLELIRLLENPRDSGEFHKIVREMSALNLGNGVPVKALLALHLGYFYIRNFNNDSALVNFQRCLDLLPPNEYLKERVEATRGIGKAMIYKGAYDKAHQVLLAGLEMTEKELLRRRDTAVAASELKILLDLGWSFVQLNESGKALKFFKRVLGLALDYNMKDRMSRIHTNMGSVYYYQNKPDSALFHFKSALNAAESVRDSVEIGNAYNNIGLIYQEMKNYTEALKYLQKSFQLSESRKDFQGQAESLNNLGEVCYAMDDFQNAERYFLKSIKISESIGHKMQQKDSYASLSRLYAKHKKFELAYQYSRQADALKDSIFNEEKNRQITEMNTKYETEKKEHENKFLREQSLNQELVNSRQRIMILGVTGVALLMVVFAFLIHRSYRQKKKANVELAGKNIQIQEKNRIVEEQNKDIKDSIRYARRLQQAILPPIDRFRDVFPDSFIFFRPKDIVSGDFYWFERFGDQVFFAAADCTGHGVPGAFMSIMGSNLLNQSLNEYAITRTDALLNSVSKGLAKALRTQDEGSLMVRDGMDIALCSVDTKKNVLTYSGAFNPVWIFRNDQVIELKPDKFPVGATGTAGSAQFSIQQFTLEKGDRIYVFSDGYADQFGGPKGKKFKYAPFQNILSKLGSFSMEEQMQEILRKHEEWKGDLEQVDDILVIGVRV
ncbi:MAG: tetratricopeptide repeat protein [Bacteroidia bacterium]|nr:tetratricopeptide repeat protein [Bacteroidia bacterium]